MAMPWGDEGNVLPRLPLTRPKASLDLTGKFAVLPPETRTSIQSPYVHSADKIYLQHVAWFAKQYGEVSVLQSMRNNDQLEIKSLKLAWSLSRWAAAWLCLFTACWSCLSSRANDPAAPAAEAANITLGWVSVEQWGTTPVRRREQWLNKWKTQTIVIWGRKNVYFLYSITLS